MLEMVPLGSLILRFSDDSLVVTRYIGGTYWKCGQLLSCPFIHSESFSPLGLLRIVVILACCQSVIPSTRLLNEELGGTCRSPIACVVLKNLQGAKVLVLDSRSTDSEHTAGWMAWYKKSLVSQKMHWLTKAGFQIQIVLSILLGKG
jgi:hypothetical protein